MLEDGTELLGTLDDGMLEEGTELVGVLEDGTELLGTLDDGMLEEGTELVGVLEDGAELLGTLDDGMLEEGTELDGMLEDGTEVLGRAVGVAQLFAFVAPELITEITMSGESEITHTRLVQFSNAVLSIDDTLEGITMLARL